MNLRIFRLLAILGLTALSIFFISALISHVVPQAFIFHFFVPFIIGPICIIIALALILTTETSYQRCRKYFLHPSVILMLAISASFLWACVYGNINAIKHSLIALGMFTLPTALAAAIFIICIYTLLPVLHKNAYIRKVIATGTVLASIISLGLLVCDATINNPYWRVLSVYPDSQFRDQIFHSGNIVPLEFYQRVISSHKMPRNNYYPVHITIKLRGKRILYDDSLFAFSYATVKNGIIDQLPNADFNKQMSAIAFMDCDLSELSDLDKKRLKTYQQGDPRYQYYIVNADKTEELPSGTPYIWLDTPTPNKAL